MRLNKDRLVRQYVASRSVLLHTAVMSSSTLMNMRTARSFAPRLRLNPARPLVQLRGKATTPFRLPDPRNEPNVSISS